MELWLLTLLYWQNVVEAFGDKMTFRPKYFVIILPIIIITIVFFYLLNTPVWLIIERLDESMDRSDAIILNANDVLKNPKLKQAIEMADDSYKKYPQISMTDSILVTPTEGQKIPSLLTEKNTLQIPGNQYAFTIQYDDKSYLLVIYFDYSQPPSA